MKLNYHTCLSGTKCILVPYRPEHVPKYHEWMKDPYLLEMTASEPLSYEEEVKMQQEWKDDEKKCTFIVLQKEQWGGKDDTTEDDKILPSNFIQDHLVAMVGDVNLFLSEISEDENDELKNDCKSSQDKEEECNSTIPQNNIRIEAELDIMIAESNAQRKGLGNEAVCLMMIYGIQYLGITRFFVKIQEDNIASRTLFETKLGFQQCAYAACFKEVSFVGFGFICLLNTCISNQTIFLWNIR